MTDQPPRERTPGAVLTDPRVEPDQLRLFDAPDDHPLLVVGCVHDHPASVYRVRALIRLLAPDVVAVELPGLAVPLFERVGREGETDEEPGGEMSAALAAGETVDAHCVGVDSLGVRFARSLLGELRRESVTVPTVRRVISSLSHVTRHALACRLSAALGRYGTPTPVRKQAYEHDVDSATRPGEQAADEQRQVTQSLSVLRALERPVADEVIDAAREQTMVANLSSLQADGSVLAVVGFDHLSGITELLTDHCGPSREVNAATLTQVWD